MPARRSFVPGENLFQHRRPAISERYISSVRSIGARASRFHSRLSDVNDDMWAHRSKTTEECRGCRRCDSVHPSIPHGRDLFERAKPGRAHNIPSGTSFALLMGPAYREGWIRWKKRSHLSRHLIGDPTRFVADHRA